MSSDKITAICRSSSPRRAQKQYTSLFGTQRARTDDLQQIQSRRYLGPPAFSHSGTGLMRSSSRAYPAARLKIENWPWCCRFAGCQRWLYAGAASPAQLCTLCDSRCSTARLTSRCRLRASRISAVLALGSASWMAATCGAQPGTKFAGCATVARTMFMAVVQLHNKRSGTGSLCCVTRSSAIAHLTPH